MWSREKLRQGRRKWVAPKLAVDPELDSCTWRISLALHLRKIWVQTCTGCIGRALSNTGHFFGYVRTQTFIQALGVPWGYTSAASLQRLHVYWTSFWRVGLVDDTLNSASSESRRNSSSPVYAHDFSGGGDNIEYSETLRAF